MLLTVIIFKLPMKRYLVEYHAGNQELLLATMKASWPGLAIWPSTTLNKTIVQGTIIDGRNRERPQRSWTDDLKTWTHLKMSELVIRAESRLGWRRLIVATCSSPPPSPPTTTWWATGHNGMDNNRGQFEKHDMTGPAVNNEDPNKWTQQMKMLTSMDISILVLWNKFELWILSWLS